MIQLIITVFAMCSGQNRPHTHTQPWKRCTITWGIWWKCCCRQMKCSAWNERVWVCMRANPSQTNCATAVATPTATEKKLTARLSKHEPVIKLLKSVNRNQCKWRQPRNSTDRFWKWFNGSWDGRFLVLKLLYSFRFRLKLASLASKLNSPTPHPLTNRATKWMVIYLINAVNRDRKWCLHCDVEPFCCQFN